jgi:Coenzyme PQQ synthesis protein D (PqqD)
MQLTHPRKRDSVVLRQLATEAMLYDPEGDRVVRLNVTARRIWELCDGERSLSAITATLENEFQVEASSEISQDVARTVGQFAAAGLLTEER